MCSSRRPEASSAAGVNGAAETLTGSLRGEETFWFTNPTGFKSKLQFRDQHGDPKVFGRLRQDCPEFKASLGSLVNSRIAVVKEREG